MLASSSGSIHAQLLLGAALSVAGVAAAADAAWRTRVDGFGPLRIGMTRTQAERAAGLALSDDRALSSAYCYYLDFTRGIKGVIFMVTEGRISRVDVLAPGYATVSGARIGDTEERLLALYGERAKFSPHKYLGAAGNYVTVSSSDGRHAVQFETRHGRVFRYRAGKFPEVALAEGCN
ncbi:MAG: hypothetical protein K8S22_10170 [Betaproteobacteria bacterium]|nr:hypothetical protein [Betaproteobacteria bacterium]